MTQPHPLPQLISITFFDGSITIFGAVKPGANQADRDAWMFRMEIRQSNTGSQIFIYDNEFIYEFMRQAENFNPDLVAPGVAHRMTDCSEIVDVDVSGMLFGMVSSGGHLLIALTDMNGNQCVAYLSPMCYAPDFRPPWYHPLTAFGATSHTSERFSPDIHRKLERFCEMIHRPRRNGATSDETSHHRKPALFLQQMLLNDLKT